MPLPKTLPITAANGEAVELTLNSGEPVFVLGANGTGKSALLVKMAERLGAEVLRIVASRPLVVENDSSQITTSQVLGMRDNYRVWDSQLAFRAKPPNAGQRAQLYLPTLIELENGFSRELATVLKSVNAATLPELQARKSPLEKINSALAAAGFPVQITITPDGQVKASKDGSPLYGVSDMSDGERAALFMLVEAMAAAAGTTILIDEPERHIHRSLLLALVNELVQIREDCCFVVATHDTELPGAFPESQVVLVRGMTAFGERWDIDVVPSSSEIPLDIRESVLGSRRRILFVEGVEDGLDYGLYNTLFGTISVIPRESSRAVEQATLGARATEGLSWLSAWGLIDRDGRPDEAVDALREQGIWCLPVYSVESIYYHPAVVEMMANKAATLHDLGSGAAATAISEATKEFTDHVERMAARAVEKTVRHRVLAAIPSWKHLSKAGKIEFCVDSETLLREEIEKLGRAAAEGDWAYIIARCPIRESTAPSKIASALGYKSRRQYEGSVRKALSQDADFRQQVIELLEKAPIALLP